PEDFLPGLRKLADDNGILLIFDEVQTGCGRTGEWFAYQAFDVTPDVMTLAKSLCGGLAGGAMLTTAEIATSLRPGMHAATFGGNPIAAVAGIATMEMIEKENLLDGAKRLSQLFGERLNKLAEQCAIIREVRVIGLMIGIELTIEGAATVKACMERNLLVNCTQGTVIRLLPAMNLTEEQANQGCDILAEVLSEQARRGSTTRN
ncbi:MAG: aminotransferase class III-fold pyridoxal phosphate-dependent enzyme, partial [Thermoguttaceae bacterium]